MMITNSREMEGKIIHRPFELAGGKVYGKILWKMWCKIR